MRVRISSMAILLLEGLLAPVTAEEGFPHALEQTRT